MAVAMKDRNRVLVLVTAKRAERMHVWFEAMRLRAAMQKIALENLTPEEIDAYVVAPR